MRETGFWGVYTTSSPPPSCYSLFNSIISVFSRQWTKKEFAFNSFSVKIKWNCSNLCWNKTFYIVHVKVKGINTAKIFCLSDHIDAMAWQLLVFFWDFRRKEIIKRKSKMHVYLIKFEAHFTQTVSEWIYRDYYWSQRECFTHNITTIWKCRVESLFIKSPIIFSLFIQQRKIKFVFLSFFKLASHSSLLYCYSRRCTYDVFHQPEQKIWCVHDLWI